MIDDWQTYEKPSYFVEIEPRAPELPWRPASLGRYRLTAGVLREGDEQPVRCGGVLDLRSPYRFPRVLSYAVLGISGSADGPILCIESSCVEHLLDEIDSLVLNGFLWTDGKMAKMTFIEIGPESAEDGADVDEMNRYRPLTMFARRVPRPNRWAAPLKKSS